MKQRVFNIVMVVVKGFLPFYLFTFLPLTSKAQTNEQMGGVYYAYPIESGIEKPQLQ